MTTDCRVIKDKILLLTYKYKKKVLNRIYIICTLTYKKPHAKDLALTKDFFENIKFELLVLALTYILQPKGPLAIRDLNLAFGMTRIQCYFLLQTAVLATTRQNFLSIIDEIPVELVETKFFNRHLDKKKIGL